MLCIGYALYVDLFKFTALFHFILILFSFFKRICINSKNKQLQMNGTKLVS